jgi:hypothetical protein
MRGGSDRMISSSFPPLAQLVRASSLYLEGPWFESKRADFLEQNGLEIGDVADVTALLRLREGVGKREFPVEEGLGKPWETFF